MKEAYAARGARMDLLEAILALTKNSSGRQMQRRSLFTAVARVTERLALLLRVGDSVTFEGRQYFLVDEAMRYVAVDTGEGRGPASLGQRLAIIPYASYEEHLFFSKHAAAIVGLFAERARQETKNMAQAEQELLKITERKMDIS